MISRFIVTIYAIFSVKKQNLIPNLKALIPYENEIGIPTYVSPAEILVKDLIHDIDKTINRTVTRTSYRYNDILNEVREKFQLIYPGTKWCGDGDNAKSPNDLGHFKKTDRCCRAHDECPFDLLANQTKFGLWNNGIFTRSHQVCDEAFYRCLKAVNSHVANSIGITYYDILRPQSFKKEYPATCVQYDREGVKGAKCIKYRLDITKPTFYQWFDNINYE